MLTPHSRRTFLSLAAVPALPALAAGKKKIAALVSEYRPGSHADAILGKILKGYFFEGRPRQSPIEIVSMYTDQVPDEDMSRELAARHGFKLLPSIREALTLTSNTSAGPRDLAVDGILLICEHGAYPYNPMGQKLYPRFEFFKQVVDVFRETGKKVPVFCDKHLSYDWDKAKWMYDQAKELKFPLMAGSVEPLARDTGIAFPNGTHVDRVVTTWAADFFDSKDSYGFHALENLQSLLENRAGGESGVVAVQCLERAAAWEWTESTAWANRLLAAALPPNSGGIDEWRAKTQNPVVFALRYECGLEAAVFRLNGLTRRLSLAADVRGSAKPLVLDDMAKMSAQFAVPEELRKQHPYNHFSATVRAFEAMVATGKAPNQIERTLLTTGMLTALHESSYQPAPMYGRSMQHGRLMERGRLLETPHLRIAYGPYAVTSKNPWVPELPPLLAAKGWKAGTFESRAAKCQAGYLYALPPGYERDSQRRYPVVYWLHGFNGGPSSAAPFVERLHPAILLGKSPPMIVVSVTDPIRVSQWTDSKDGKYPVESMIIQDLIPHIDATFRTIPNRNARGIDGFSMGGYGAAYLGFRYPEQFGAISILAGGHLSAERMCTVRDGIMLEKVYNGDRAYAESHSVWTVIREQAEAVRKWHPFMRVHVGDKDVSKDLSIEFHELLVKLHVDHEWGISPNAEHNAGQTFDNWPGNPFEFYLKSFAAVG